MSALALALAKAQGEFKPPTKNCHVNYEYQGQRVKYSYADLAGVMQAVIPALSKHGLAIVHAMTFMEDLFVLETSLMHESGEKITTFYPLPHPGSLKPQAFGSSYTYARRYSVCGLLAIAAEDDDDGAKAEPPAQTRPPVSPREPKEFREARERREQMERDFAKASTPGQQHPDTSEKELDKALATGPMTATMVEREELSLYRIPFGQFTGKSIREIGLYEAGKYVDHLVKKAKTDGQNIAPDGQVAQFIKMVDLAQKVGLK